MAKSREFYSASSILPGVFVAWSPHCFQWLLSAPVSCRDIGVSSWNHTAAGDSSISCVWNVDEFSATLYLQVRGFWWHRQQDSLAWGNKCSAFSSLRATSNCTKTNPVLLSLFSNVIFNCYCIKDKISLHHSLLHRWTSSYRNWYNIPVCLGYKWQHTGADYTLHV